MELTIDIHGKYVEKIRLIEPSFFNQGETYIWLKR